MVPAEAEDGPRWLVSFACHCPAGAAGSVRMIM
jgi:hypothetical protein